MLELLAVAALVAGITGAWSPCGFSMVETLAPHGYAGRRRVTVAACATFALGALAGGVAYAALFLLLAVLTKNAVVLGLIYALIWESLVGGLVPGAQTLSVQQWSLAVVERVLGDEAARAGVGSAVSFGVGLTLIVVVTVVATAYAGRKLQTVRIGESD